MLGQGLVRAIWTDDEALSTKINSRVAHYTGQAELAAAIHDGLEARKQGDEETATAKLGRAVALAHQSGNEDTAKLLAKVVDVVNPETGTVRLKKQVEDADEMALDTRSTKTVRVGAAAGADHQPMGPGVSPGERPSRPERFLVAQMPARVPLSAEVSLLVRVSATRLRSRRPGRRCCRGLRSAPREHGSRLSCRRRTSLRPLTALEQVISVPASGDSLPVRFAVPGPRAGPQRVMITAWAGGTFLAELGLELSVEQTRPVRGRPQLARRR